MRIGFSFCCVPCSANYITDLLAKLVALQLLSFEGDGISNCLIYSFLVELSSQIFFPSLPLLVRLHI